MGDGINTFNEKDLSLCESCVKVGLNVLMWANYLLEMVHNDICRPLNPPTHIRNQYFITFLDDKSKFTMIYLLKYK
jgi:hypothetical protein